MPKPLAPIVQAFAAALAAVPCLAAAFGQQQPGSRFPVAAPLADASGAVFFEDRMEANQADGRKEDGEDAPVLH